ncbi:MAG TPA: MarR family transcriptional regulator [Allosphingosinicella sp.]|jgi:DNA-binding transcriptional ArsR family regulator
MAPEALETVEYRGEPRVLLFGDSPAAIERARRSAEQAGCSVAAAAPIEGAAERLDKQVHVDAVLIEAERASAGLDRLLECVEKRARSRRHRSVISAPDELIDAVFARTSHRDVFHLCRPNAVERVAAVALASIRRAPRLHDGKEDVNAILQQLSDEAARIAGVLASLAHDGSESPAAEGEAGGDDAREGPPIDAPFVRAMIRARRLRDSYFKGGLFADPAWDMLLDLMAARLEKHRVAVSSLCIAAAVPPTTALRWIKTLTDKGVLVRCADPADGRRVYIELSDEAARALAAYIRAAQRISPIAP